jgi:uncharacterized damage-inducible protein DinB
MAKYLKYLIFIFFISIFSLGSCTKEKPQTDLKQELLAGIKQSRDYTLAIAEQMPDSLYGFQPTPDVMTFAEHHRHNAIFTVNQLANRLNPKTPNPYKDNKPKDTLGKAETVAEINRMYDFMEAVLSEMDQVRLLEEIEFGKEKIPAWRMFTIVENHLIHHRGQTIVYLRLNNIVPKGYFGW